MIWSLTFRHLYHLILCNYETMGETRAFRLMGMTQKRKKSLMWEKELMEQCPWADESGGTQSLGGGFGGGFGLQWRCGHSSAVKGEKEYMEGWTLLIILHFFPAKEETRLSTQEWKGAGGVGSLQGEEKVWKGHLRLHHRDWLVCELLVTELSDKYRRWK